MYEHLPVAEVAPSGECLQKTIIGMDWWRMWMVAPYQRTLGEVCGLAAIWHWVCIQEIHNPCLSIVSCINTAALNYVHIYVCCCAVLRGSYSAKCRVRLLHSFVYIFKISYTILHNFWHNWMMWYSEQACHLVFIRSLEKWCHLANYNLRLRQ